MAIAITIPEINADTAADGIRAILLLLTLCSGCSVADVPKVQGEYRESLGTVAKVTLEQSDPVLRITEFIQRKDSSVILPQVYYYGIQKTSTGTRRVEKRARTFRTTNRQSKNFLFLPVGEEITIYYLLVRKPIPKIVERNGEIKTEYEWADWCLLELKAEDVSPDKPLPIPAFENLAKQELTNEKQELLDNLVQIFDKNEVAALKAAGEPVAPKRVYSNEHGLPPVGKEQPLP